MPCHHLFLSVSQEVAIWILLLHDHVALYLVSARDYQGKRVNPPYKPSIQGNPSQVIFRHCTQFFRGYYSRVAWILSWRVCLCPFVSKENLRRCEMSSLCFDNKQGSFGSRYVLIHFETLIGVLMRDERPLHKR